MQIEDTENMFDFFKYIKAAAQPVDTFELGNELGDGPIQHFGDNISRAVDAIWSGGGGNAKPGLAGPSNAGDNTDMSYLQTTFGKLASEQDYITGITFHAYPFHNGGGKCIERTTLPHLPATIFLWGHTTDAQLHTWCIQHLHSDASLQRGSHVRFFDVAMQLRTQRPNIARRSLKFSKD